MSSRAALSLAVLLVIPGPRSVEAAPVDPYLPDDSDFVLVVEARQLRDAPLVKAGLPLWPLKPSFLSFILAGSLKPLLELDSLTLAGPTANFDARWLLIQRGKPVRALEALIERELGVKKEKSGPFTIYEWKEDALGRPLFACFLDDTTAVRTPSREQLAACLARKQGTRKGAIAKELQAVIEQQKSTTVWFAGLASAELKKFLGTSPETQKVFNDLEHFRGGITVADGLDGAVLIQTRNGQTAGAVRKFLEGVKAILSLAALDRQQEGRKLTDLVAAIQLLSVKETVTVRLKLSREQIEQALPPRKQ